jgi:hypothetical protein
MNFDLAVMALEGLSKAPVRIHSDGDVLTIESTPASFRELARILLLLGGGEAEPGDGFDLQPGIHVTKASPALRLRISQPPATDN